MTNTVAGTVQIDTTRPLIIACGALVQELRSVLRANKLGANDREANDRDANDRDANDRGGVEVR